MIGYLIVLFLLMPFIDIYLLIVLTEKIGLLNVLTLILLTGIIGAFILRREGRKVFQKLRTSVTAKEVSRNLMEGVLLVLGGLMLLSPGLVTDLIGLLFVLTPTRTRIMLFVMKRLEKRSNFEVRVETF